MGYYIQSTVAALLNVFAYSFRNAATCFVLKNKSLMYQLKFVQAHANAELKQNNVPPLPLQ